MQRVFASCMIFSCMYCTASKAVWPPAGSMQVRSGSYKLPRGYFCGADAETKIWYPKDLKQGPFPIAIFGHGSGGGMLWDLSKSIASLGFVVIAPATGNCGEHYKDILYAIEWSKSNSSAHKALGHVDWSRCGLFGHSFGGHKAMGAAWLAQNSGYSHVKAVVAAHGFSAWPLTIPTMLMSGSRDRRAQRSAGPAFRACSAAYKVYAAVAGGKHMEPNQGGRLNPFGAHFLGCHVAGLKKSCDMIYGNAPDSVCRLNKMSNCEVVSPPGPIPTPSPPIAISTTLPPIASSTTTAGPTTRGTTTTLTYNGIPVSIREVGGTGCFRSMGSNKKLKTGATNDCARFMPFELTFRSLDEPGQCLTKFFGGKGPWGLWTCSGKWNQQLQPQGKQWCTRDSNCVEESEPSSFTSTSTEAPTTSTTLAIPATSTTLGTSLTTSTTTISTTGLTTTAGPTTTAQVTTTKATDIVMTVREAGGNGCLRSQGGGKLLEKGATSNCARFLISGKAFKSMDVQGQCLDYLGSRGWGLWGCHGGDNQQFQHRDDQWCSGSHCVEASGSSSTTITTTTFVETTTFTSVPTPVPTLAPTPQPTQAPTPSPEGVNSGDTVFLKTRSGFGNHIDVEGVAVRSRWQSQGNMQALTIEKQGGGAVSSGDVVFLKAHTGAHLDVAEGVVRARWTDTGAWQAMVITKRMGSGAIAPDDIVCLETHTSKHLDVGDDHIVRARWNDCGDWQAMRIEKEVVGALFSGDSISLLAHTGNRIEADGTYVGARWSDPGLWQTFTIENYGGRAIFSGDAVFIKAHTGALIHVQDTAVAAQWYDYGAWQTFHIERKNGEGPVMPGDGIFLRSHTGRFIEIDGDKVQCRWFESGDWQTLIVEKQSRRLLNAVSQNDDGKKQEQEEHGDFFVI